MLIRFVLLYQVGNPHSSHSSVQEAHAWLLSHTQFPSVVAIAIVPTTCSCDVHINITHCDSCHRYYKTNEVRTFQYDRPFHKGEKNRECEFAVSTPSLAPWPCSWLLTTSRPQTLWIERTRFSTSQSFPGVISWFEVERTESVSLN